MAWFSILTKGRPLRCGGEEQKRGISWTAGIVWFWCDTRAADCNKKRRMRSRISQNFCWLQLELIYLAQLQIPCQSQWPHDLRRRSAAPAEIVVSNPTGGMDVCSKCCVLSGIDFCERLITRAEESLRCVWSRNLVNEETLAHWGAIALKTKDEPHNCLRNFIELTQISVSE
jgi:hypothetical protein